MRRSRRPLLLRPIHVVPRERPFRRERRPRLPRGAEMTRPKRSIAAAVGAETAAAAGEVGAVAAVSAEAAAGEGSGGEVDPVPKARGAAPEPGTPPAIFGLIAWRVSTRRAGEGHEDHGAAYAAGGWVAGLRSALVADSGGAVAQWRVGTGSSATAGAAAAAVVEAAEAAAAAVAAAVGHEAAKNRPLCPCRRQTCLSPKGGSFATNASSKASPKAGVM